MALPNSLINIKIQWIYRWLFVAMVVLFSGVGFAADDCACPPVECDPCEDQKSVSFYTEKCAGGEKLKSCAKASCVPKKPLPMHCLAVNIHKPKAKKVARDMGRMPASVPSKVKTEPVIAGLVTALEGKAWVKDSGAKKSQLQLNAPVHVFDQIHTDSNGKVQVDFRDGSRILIFANSVVRLSLVEKQKNKNLWNQLLDLFKGRVRNQVKAGGGKYQVRTKHAIVAGQGADFFVNQSKSDREVTRVETIKGQVELSSRDGEQSIQVKNGQRASLVVAASEASVFTDQEISEFVERGYLTPVHNMSPKEIGRLTSGSSFVKSTKVKQALRRHRGKGNSRRPASASDFICSQPAAGFNQCAWECLNNPKGAKACKADLPQVSCVRRRCNANGMWADEIPLPAMQADKCDGQATKVGSCDY